MLRIVHEWHNLKVVSSYILFHFHGISLESDQNVTSYNDNFNLSI